MIKVVQNQFQMNQLKKVQNHKKQWINTAPKKTLHTVKISRSNLLHSIMNIDKGLSSPQTSYSCINPILRKASRVFSICISNLSWISKSNRSSKRSKRNKEIKQQRS